MVVKELPIVKHADEDTFCFFDERLKELRDIYKPFNVFKLNDFEIKHYKEIVKKGETFNKAFRQKDKDFKMV